MNISEVRVRLVPNRTGNERLKAYCSITLDSSFVIRDLKVIDGANGLFVAMPSRKLADRCPRCGVKNHLRAAFCNECGSKLGRNRVRKDTEGRPKLHADVAHPINSACREQIEHAVREAYEQELELSKKPGYKPAYVDDDDYSDSDYDDLIADLKREAATRHGARTDRAPSEEDVPMGYDPDSRDAVDDEPRPEPKPRSEPPPRPEPKPRSDDAVSLPEHRRERQRGGAPAPSPSHAAPSRPAQDEQSEDSDFGLGIL